LLATSYSVADRLIISFDTPTGTRIWKYDPEEFEEEESEGHEGEESTGHEHHGEHESHGHEEHGHGEHEHDDDGETEMFYHLITFK